MLLKCTPNGILLAKMIAWHYSGLFRLEMLPNIFIACRLNVAQRVVAVLARGLARGNHRERAAEGLFESQRSAILDATTTSG